MLISKSFKATGREDMSPCPSVFFPFVEITTKLCSS